MDQQRLNFLFSQYQSDQLSQAEETEWLEAVINPGNQEQVNALARDIFQRQDLLKYSMPDSKAQDVLDYIVQQPQLGTAKTYVLWKRIVTVAAAVAAIVIGVYFFTAPRHIVNNGDTAAYAKNDVAPGKMGATLSLANGRKIYISDASSGKLAEASGVTISKTVDGKIIYKVTASNGGSVEYNTLQTSKGEQATVFLPDGTGVILNAASSVRFPSTFAGLKDRKVELTGEAYFTVKHDAGQPFKVLTKGQLVEDIGTEFNISAYSDDGVVKTTLVEGSAMVSLDKTASTGGAAHNDNMILKPSQQSILNAGALKVVTVDLALETAWKNGKFAYSDTQLKDVMKQVARWYDVEVVFESETLKAKKLSGSVSRYAQLSGILKAIDFTTKVKFKIEGRTVTVLKNEDASN